MFLGVIMVQMFCDSTFVIVRGVVQDVWLPSCTLYAAFAAYAAPPACAASPASPACAASVRRDQATTP